MRNEEWLQANENAPRFQEEGGADIEKGQSRVAQVKGTFAIRENCLYAQAFFLGTWPWSQNEIL